MELKLPPRIKQFFWLVLHQKLLINHERVRRNLAANGDYALCGCGNETVLHVLCDCSFAKKVWTMVIPTHLLPFFLC